MTVNNWRKKKNKQGFKGYCLLQQLGDEFSERNFLFSKVLNTEQCRI